MPNIEQIAAEARDLVDASSTTYPDAILLRRINAAYEEIVGDLISKDKSWKFDDSNYTDLPVGVGDLVAGQQSYSFNATLLTIDRVEVLDNNGTYHRLAPIDEAKIDEALDEYQKIDGLPVYYGKRYNSIFLYPAPAAANVTLTGGLIIHYRRTANVFASLTGSNTPGFPSPYHYILSYKAALPVAMKHKKDRVSAFVNEINRLHAGLMALSSVRDSDKLPRLVPRIDKSK